MKNKLKVKVVTQYMDGKVEVTKHKARYSGAMSTFFINEEAEENGREVFSTSIYGKLNSIPFRIESEYKTMFGLESLFENKPCLMPIHEVGNYEDEPIMYYINQFTYSIHIPEIHIELNRDLEIRIPMGRGKDIVLPLEKRKGSHYVKSDEDYRLAKYLRGIVEYERIYTLETNYEDEIIFYGSNQEPINTSIDEWEAIDREDHIESIRKLVAGNPDDSNLIMEDIIYASKQIDQIIWVSTDSNIMVFPRIEPREHDRICQMAIDKQKEQS